MTKKMTWIHGAVRDHENEKSRILYNDCFHSIPSLIFRGSIVCVEFHLGVIDNDRLPEYQWRTLQCPLNLLECYDLVSHDLPLEIHLLQSLYPVLWEDATCSLSLLLFSWGSHHCTNDGLHEYPWGREEHCTIQTPLWMLRARFNACQMPRSNGRPSTESQ
jgi:hypothetical protein